MLKIVYCVAVVIFLITMWYFVFRIWRKKQADKEVRVLDKRAMVPTNKEMRFFHYYKDSFDFISKYAYHGKYKAFLYAFRIGYTAGREGDIPIKEKEQCSIEKGGANDE